MKDTEPTTGEILAHRFGKADFAYSKILKVLLSILKTLRQVCRYLFCLRDKLIFLILQGTVRLAVLKPYMTFELSKYLLGRNTIQKGHLSRLSWILRDTLSSELKMPIEGHTLA